MVDAGMLGEREAERAALDEVAATRFALPALAAHLSDDALRAAPAETKHQLTLQKSVQSGLEAVARQAAQKLGDRVSVAMVLADARTGEILGSVGSADYFDPRRFGWIDMTKASRSPGSTLKPFIYGLAFEQGLVAQETLIEDRPADFGGYRPKKLRSRLPGRRQRAAGAAAFAERPGGTASGRGRAGPARRALPPRRRRHRRCRPARRRDWQSASAASA